MSEVSEVDDKCPSREKMIAPCFLWALGKVVGKKLYLNVDLSSCSRWRIGGIADCIVEPSSTEELAKVILLAKQHNVPYVVIGGTSNLLFSDQGIQALVIRLGQNMAQVAINNTNVWGQCGAWVPGFARKVASAGLTGAEHLSGIPGTLGGLIYMNGGSQRKGIADNVISVRAVSQEGEIKQYTVNDCKFKYRHSLFQENGDVIVDARFSFMKGSTPLEIKREMLVILRSRRKRFPLKLPNCGSVFVSDPAMYADYGPPGALIERCGLKGTEQGGAQISNVHANFIVNNGNATARDILFLVNLVRERVYKKTGYLMDSEVKYVSSTGKVMEVHRALSDFPEKSNDCFFDK